MAKISELADGGNLLNDDELIVLRAGGNVRATVANLPEVDASGNQSFADNEKAIFGTGSDLQIYHDGGHSYIDDAGTGLLRLRSNTVYLEKYTGELLADFNADGYVSLLHDNSEKFRTTSTGIDVTGTATMDGLTVQTAQGDITIPTSTSSLNFARAGANYIRATDAAGSFHFVTGANDFATTRLRISANGDVALFEDTGTTPKLFWDSSAESLGIGTSSPSGALDIGGQHVLNDNYDALGASFTRNGAYGSVLSLGRQGVSSGVTLDYPADNTFALSTNGTERMRIDSAGNVGIGTSSPTEPLEVSRLGGSFTYPALDGNTVGFLHCGAGSATSGSQLALGAGNAGQSALVFADTDSSNVGRLLYDHTSNFMQFRVNGDEAMRIDSSGNVGIGTDSPSNALTVVDSTSYGQLRLSSSDADATIKYSALSFGQYAAAEEGYAGILGFSNSTENRIAIGGSTGLLNAATAIQFFTAASATTTTGSEAMRIDSSQNLLVGKTAADQFTTAGHELHEDGLYVGTRDGSNVAVLNRETSDGSILQFRKDNATVGSIGADSGDLLIGTGITGLRFNDSADQIIPRNTSGTQSAGVTDLGNSSSRFKDLYLSGGAYLGGVAAANKLDDYEEGTFTPEFSATGLSVTYDIQSGNYTKIGNIVYFQIQFGTDAASGTSASEALTISGLPFNPSGVQTSGRIGLMYGLTSDKPNITWVAGVGSSTITLYEGDTTQSFVTLKSDILNTGTNKNRMNIVGFYRTDA